MSDLKVISKDLDFFTMANYVDSIQIIVKLTYNGNTLTVMGWLHYLDVFFLKTNPIEANVDEYFSSFIINRKVQLEIQTIFWISMSLAKQF